MTRPRPLTWTRLAGVVLAVLAVGALLAAGLDHRTTLTTSPLAVRPAPDFSLPGLSGRTADAVRLADLRGQVVVVNFWASWCAECRTEQSALNATWQRYRDEGVVVVGVDFEDAAGDARTYAARSGVSYPVVVDRDSNAALAYGLRGVPETYLIDRRGMIVDRIIGPATTSRLSNGIDGLLAGVAR